MKYKKYISILCIALIFVLNIPFIYSCADDVTIKNTFGDITYGYTNNDFLTDVNYNTYYDTVDNGLKYSVNSDVFVNNNDVDYGSNMINTVLSNMNNLNNTEFPDVNGKHIGLYTWWRSSYSVYFYTLVVDGADDIAFVNGYLCSKSKFTIKQYIYKCGSGSFNGTYTRYTENGHGYNIIDDTENIQYDSTHDIYYRNYGGMCVYSEVPYLFTYQHNSQYTDVDYIGRSPYEYQFWYNVYNAYVNNTDNTGFIIDRRSKHMIEQTSGGGSVSPSQYGFKQGSFKNAIYGSTFDNQNIFVAYELNDNSTTIKDDLYLRLDYVFNLDGVFNNYDLDYSGQYSTINGLYDLYSLSDSNYVNVDLDDIFRSMSLNDTTINTQYEKIDRFYDPSKYNNVVSPVRKRGVDPLDCFNILYNNGLITSSPVSINYNDEFLDSLTVNYKDFGFNVKINTNSIYNSSSTSIPSINRLDSCNLTVIESIYNVKTGESSQACMFSYDYLTKSMQEVGTLEKEGEIFSGDYSNGSQSSLSNPNSNNMNYDIATGQYYPSNAYGGSSSAYNGGNTVIVNPTQIPYLLVDVPEGEWMKKTPNLTGILTDFKNALEEVHDESILPIMTETYNYLPVPMWQYLTYAVELLLMIGIWRGITRR